MSVILFLDHLDIPRYQRTNYVPSHIMPKYMLLPTRNRLKFHIMSMFKLPLGPLAMYAYSVSRPRIFATDLTRREQHSTYFCWLMLGRPSRTWPVQSSIIHIIVDQGVGTLVGYILLVETILYLNYLSSLLRSLPQCSCKLAQRPTIMLHTPLESREGAFKWHAV